MTTAQFFQITHHTQKVDDVEVFYRAAGSTEKPIVLLLHGYPSSSHQYRNLIPALAQEYRVIAPDLPGFGSTVAPPRGEYDYTFDNLAATIDGFTEALGLERFALYVFDYGAPVGFRLATAHPERITAIVTQNGNAYQEGITEAWGPIQAYWADDSQESRDALRGLLTRETTEWQYFEGAPDALKNRISPDAIHHDQAILDRDAEVQLDLFLSYRTNVEAYPRWQEYLRTSKPPVLAVWGKNDPFFGPAGARAFQRDVPEAEVELLDAGHFALETHGEVVAERVLGFLRKAAIA
ncbi:MAG: alpha/beta hydrolase [Planctomycetota bacterium]